MARVALIRMRVADSDFSVTRQPAFGWSLLPESPRYSELRQFSASLCAAGPRRSMGKVLRLKCCGLVCGDGTVIMHGRGCTFSPAFGLLSALSMKLAAGFPAKAKRGRGMYRFPKAAFPLALLLSMLLPCAAEPKYRAVIVPKLVGIAYYNAVKRGGGPGEDGASVALSIKTIERTDI
jgi:hypothetical protein